MFANFLVHHSDFYGDFTRSTRRDQIEKVLFFEVSRLIKPWKPLIFVALYYPVWKKEDIDLSFTFFTTDKDS